MISRNGVYYNLELSPFRYKGDTLEFVFSSKSHLEKFKLRLNQNRKTINESLTNRFNVAIDVKELSDVILYKKVETRGFLILSKDGENVCLENLAFVGKRVTNGK